MPSIRLKIEPNFLASIPSKPGIYRFLTDNNDILYIGASSNLHKRISHHISNFNSIKENKYYVLKEYSAYIEYCCYSSSEEAFEAEKVEIWTQKPPYNRKGVRSGSYSYLIFRRCPFPQILCLSSTEYNKIDNEDEFYRFNLPYTKLKRDFHVIRKIIPFCMPSSQSTCWDHHLNLCRNSCRDIIETKRDSNYNQFISIIDAIRGQNQVLINHWKDLIDFYIQNLRFEEAKKILDAIKIMNELRIKFCGKGIIREVDRFYFKSQENKQKFQVQILSFMNGRIVSETNDKLDFPDNISQARIIDSYLFDFYCNSGSAPSKIQIYFPYKINTTSIVKNWLKRYFHIEISLEIFLNCILDSAKFPK
ncbi:MAG: GIY-YIG nuclease family protein [Candidatus Hodarchaeota archaeon]